MPQQQRFETPPPPKRFGYRPVSNIKFIEDGDLDGVESEVSVGKEKERKPFHSFYQGFCKKSSIEPLSFLIENSSFSNIFEVDLDLISQDHWKNCINALKSSKQKFKAVRIAWDEYNDVSEVSKFTNKALPKGVPSNSSNSLAKESLLYKQMRATNQISRKTSARSLELVEQLDVSASSKFIRVISQCFSSTLVRLEIIGIALNKSCISFMQKGLLEAKESLRYLSLKNTCLGDDAFKDMGPVMPQFVNLNTLQLSGCMLTDDSCSFILSLIKGKNTKRCNEMWQISLRGDQEYEDNIEDLVALDLSNNYFTSSTARSVSHILIEGCGLKRLDLSRNLLDSRGISYFMDVLSHNSTVEYINLSRNKGIKEFTERATKFIHQFEEHDFVYIKEKRAPRKKKKSKKLKKSNNIQKPPSSVVSETSETNSDYQSCNGRIEDTPLEREEVNKDTKNDAEMSSEEKSERTLRLKRESELLSMRMELKEFEEIAKEVKLKDENKIKHQEEAIEELREAVNKLTTVVSELQETKSLENTTVSFQQESEEYNSSKHLSPPSLEKKSTTSNISSPNEEISKRLSELWKKK